MSLNNFSLLFVEDNKDAQEHIRLIFEDDVKDLYIASDGIEGLKVYKNKSPDIILTDINMPNMDGLSMVKEIKNIDKNQPILMMSAFDDKENLLEAINIGCNGFVSKPVNIDFLYDKLNSIAQKLHDEKEKQNLKNLEIQKLYNLAHYDTLTNIPNKFLFEIELDRAVSQAKRDKSKIALFFIDLDNFKEVNDTFGHEAGDYTLKTIVNNMQKVIRNEDILARRSGDEFLLMVKGDWKREDLSSLANKIIKATSAPIKYSNDVIFISSSIGISVFPSDTNSPQELINLSDKAMYKAKKAGKSHYVFYGN